MNSTPPSKPTLKVTITTHFAEDDPECMYDYMAVTIDIDGKCVASYGDDYHEKGEQKAEGFADGLRYNNEVKVKYKTIADWEE